MAQSIDDEVHVVLETRVMCYDERVRLPDGLPRDLRRRVNNALVRAGAVKRGGEYHFHPEGCAPLILAWRFRRRPKPRPVRTVFRQRSVFDLFEERERMSKQICVVGVRSGRDARAETIGDSLEAMQTFVGGDIEMHGLGDGISLVCNEDGMALGLPQNGCGLLGPYFFTKTNEEGDSVSLSDEEATACMAYWAQYRTVMHRARTIEVRGFGSLEEMLETSDRKKFDAEHAN